jgi:hypothetical protein
MELRCPCGRPRDPAGYAEPITSQATCSSVSAAKNVQSLLNRLLTTDDIDAPTHSQLAAFSRAAHMLVEAGYLAAASPEGHYIRTRAPTPLCRSCYLRETRSLYGSIDQGWYERKAAVGSLARRRDLEPTGPYQFCPVCGTQRDVSSRECTICRFDWSMLAPAPERLNDASRVEDEPATLVMPAPAITVTCGYCLGPFEVSTEIGAVSVHDCGMKVLWTGVGEHLPGEVDHRMKVVHDPGDAKALGCLALLVAPAILALIATGNIGAAVLVAIGSVVVLLVVVFLWRGLVRFSDIMDNLSGRR